MTYTAFITRLYGRVPLKHGSTLAQLRELTVQQLAEMASRRVTFMEGSAEFTLPAAEPYNGEWAGPGLAGFPLDLLELDGVYTRLGETGWAPLAGPVDIADLRAGWTPSARAPSPFEIYPTAFAWWDGRLWLGQLGADVDLKIDYFRDGTRDETTGVKIATNSTLETNGWLDRGADALEYAVLAAYFALPLSQNTEQVQICNAQANAYLNVLSTETRLKTGASFQAPMCF